MDEDRRAAGAPVGPSGETERIDVAAVPPPPPPDGDAPLPVPAIVEWLPPPGSPAPVPDGSKPAIRLWSAGVVGATSFLLGYPAGLGLAARNWYRMGQRPLAYVHLAVGVVATVLIVLVPDFGTGLAGGVNLVVAGYLFFQTQAVHEDARVAGFTVGGGGFAQGLLTVVGGWALVLVPAIALGVTVDGGDSPEGAIVFGSGGTGCEVEGQASSFTADPKKMIHVVAFLAREAEAGEIVTLTITDPGEQVLLTEEIPIDAPANCLFVDYLQPDAGFEPGTYLFDATIGRERAARGELMIVVPGASP